MDGEPEHATHVPEHLPTIAPSTHGVPIPLEVGTQSALQPTRQVGELKASPVVPVGARPEPGQRLGDFFLLEKLGAGSFATVFLAIQVSLGRNVALKIAQTQDNEAETLASLEHENIVPVYAESIDPERKLRLMCMKFVPGTTLERVSRELAHLPREQWSGQAILDAISKLSRHEAVFDLAAMRDRQLLADFTFEQAVCWLGARLSEALAHAHARGVLHRDIKPANILMNHYGRPLLSDFNLALLAKRGAERDHFGGTLRYMAPEHLLAFLPDAHISREFVDQRSDIYSLGVVLYELLTGQPLFNNPVKERATSDLVRQLAEQRQSHTSAPRQIRPEIHEALDRVVRRCLEPEAGKRYQNAEELHQALEGCNQLLQWEDELPPPTRLTRWCDRYPMALLFALIFLPHLFGSLVNIAYNTFVIVDTLSPSQQGVFHWLVLVYNLIAYPTGLFVFWKVLLPISRMRARLSGPEPLEAEEVAFQRHRAVTAPTIGIILGCLGWLPVGVLFPLGIHLLADPLPFEVFGHFFVSFAIAGLIAMTYSFFGLQVFVVRILYPRLWVDPRTPGQQARRELEAIEGKLRLFQILAGLIPLSGAVMMIGISGDQPLTLVFRLLIVGLIGLGMAGFSIALLASHRINRTLAVLLGGPRSRVAQL